MREREKVQKVLWTVIVGATLETAWDKPYDAGSFPYAWGCMDLPILSFLRRKGREIFALLSGPAARGSRSKPPGSLPG